MVVRRKLELEDLNAARAESERLLRQGYSRNGKWSLGQVCFHMRTTIEANLDGYPRWMVILGYPLRPILRWLMLPRLMKGNSPAGIKTAPMFVPPNDLEDAREVTEFAKCVDRFNKHTGALHPHPGFGKLPPEEFNRFHAAHAAHHLSFLEPAASTTPKNE